MLELNGELVPNYIGFITGAGNAIWPLIAVTCGIFLTFAIANKVVYFIQVSTKKKN